MRKLVLFFFFISLSDVYAANWIQIGYDDGVKYFIDKSTIYRSKGLSKAWFLSNYETQHQVLNLPFHLSRVESLHFNCSERTVSVAAVAFYSEHDGKGIGTFHNVGKEFVDIPPNTSYEMFFWVLCGKNNPN